jgi:hypothetical protein
MWSLVNPGSGVLSYSIVINNTKYKDIERFPYKRPTLFSRKRD